jgi:hypothetical protein
VTSVNYFVTMPVFKLCVESWMAICSKSSKKPGHCLMPTSRFVQAFLGTGHQSSVQNGGGRTPSGRTRHVRAMFRLCRNCPPADLPTCLRGLRFSSICHCVPEHNSFSPSQYLKAVVMKRDSGSFFSRSDPGPMAPGSFVDLQVLHNVRSFAPVMPSRRG